MSTARENFGRMKTGYCIVGHTHRPTVFVLDERGECSAREFSPNVKLALGESRMIINTGSIGQPRDGNPEAAYAIYDSDMQLMRLYRVPYDIRVTQDRMMDRGLPVRLVGRLESGT
jgi:diadenosine tetraphosphatase ApaH/serine/threonine PP2A family protein phosphatase